MRPLGTPLRLRRNTRLTPGYAHDTDDTEPAKAPLRSADFSRLTNVLLRIAMVSAARLRRIAVTLTAKIAVNRVTFGKYHNNHRKYCQRLVLNRMLGEWQGFLTTSKYAMLAKCSADTAQRDIKDLCERGTLVQNGPGGRSTSYRLGGDPAVNPEL